MISQIRTREGELVLFDRSRIKNAVRKARLAVGLDKDIEEKITSRVVLLLNRRFKDYIPGVEDIQDLVEEVLIKEHFVDVAKAYILYRERRKGFRIGKLVKDELKLSVNALHVLQRRYLLRDKEGNVIETPLGMFKRIAKAIAKADKKYKQNYRKSEREFFEVMSNLEFLPNTPTLMNAGLGLNLSACYVLPVHDSLESIFDTLKTMALLHQTAGGTGFSFSKLRPKGSIIGSTKGRASGPVSFMKIYDVTTEVMKKGGKRRGANMGVLDIRHPDVIEFITCKEKPGAFRNFNISVGADDKFMGAVKKNKEYDLIDPRTNKKVRKLNAKQVFDLICLMAWKTGDPGVIFLDKVNRKHMLKEKIEATNPCGEQPLTFWESCNLGSINLANFVKNGRIDWDRLKKVVHVAVHFLDNVIDENNYIRKEIRDITLNNRKIGLGVMGFAEMLIMLGIKYDSHKALEIANKVMKFISDESKKESMSLGKKRGNFPNFKKSKFKVKYMRNATVTTIAPTGTISIFAGCSSGIEPLFSIAFIREILEGTRLMEVNPLFEFIAKEKGFYSEKLMREIARTGSVQKLKIPKDIKNLFVTAHDIKPEWHVRMQAVFQKYVDNAVSKTVNLSKDATKEEIKKVYLLAYELGCKGVTVFRYGSKGEQVLYLGLGRKKMVRASAEFAGGCPGLECGH